MRSIWSCTNPKSCKMTLHLCRMNFMNWDHLRTLLAIGRSGTLSAAARQLGVNQTTVTRRLEAAEQVLGSALFLRLDGRLAPTETGDLVLAQVAKMDLAAQALDHAVRDAADDLVGPVTVSATDGIMAQIVVPALPGLFGKAPGVQPVLQISTQNVDLQTRQADIALRLGRPDGPGMDRLDMQMRKVASVAFAVYAGGPDDGRPTPSVKAASPVMSSESGVKRDLAVTVPTPAWVTYDATLAHLPESRWTAGQLTGAAPTVVTNSLTTMIAAVQAGLGQAVLPCYLADRQAGLRRLGNPVLQRDLWMVVQADVARLPRVRVVGDWLIQVFQAARTDLAQSLVSDSFEGA